MKKSFSKFFLAPLTVLVLASFALAPIAEAGRRRWWRRWRALVVAVALMPVAAVASQAQVNNSPGRRAHQQRAQHQRQQRQ